MDRLHSILCHINVESDETEALQLAVSVARPHDAEVSVIDVQREPTWYQRLVDGVDAEIATKLVRNRLTVLETITSSARRSDQQIFTKILLGSPFQELIREVLRHSHDLVITAGLARRGLQRSLFGSTAAHLVRKCPCPVWLVQPGAEPLPRRVLVAISPDPHSCTSLEFNRKLVRLARAVCGQLDAELWLLHVWNEGVYRTGRWESSDRQYRQMLRNLQQGVRSVLMDFLGKIGAPDLEERLILKRGLPGEVIASQARSREIDLIVMGSIGRAGVQGLLIGNVAEVVLDNAPCAILTVKPDGFVSPVELEA